MGLSPEDEPLISQYLLRSGAGGGGARSQTKITEELFPKAKSYESLSTKRKDQVNAQQRQEWQWINDHARTNVFSTQCNKFLPSGSPHCACVKCVGLLSNHKFKKAIKKLCPEDSNYKYNNQIYCGEALGQLYGKCAGLKDIFEAKVVFLHADNKSPALRYAIGVLSGKYKGDDIFGGLLNAMIMKSDKEDRGVGTQGMRYAPQVMEFFHILHMHSPRAFKFISKYLPAPTERTLQYVSFRP
ncbi:hypothetical protein B0H13DRAFT_1656278 [Mycena leptocephala]|nr:hypothetical protein B0H13DRAFT_1656278 [Mycena leptocephala]